MKVILLEDVKALGKKGEIVEINDGYARNFVLPKKLGLEANGKNLNDLKLKSANDEKVAKENLEAAKRFGEELGTKEIVLKMKSGEGGKAFGSISSKEIAKATLEQLNMEIEKKKIQIEDPIKSFGVHTVKVKLHPKVTATLKVKVTEE